jgi:tyrosine-specific transport protein
MARQEGVPITTILHDITGHPWVSFLGAFFGFFAIITSLLGVSLSMIDFMGDGLSLKRTGWHRLLLTLMVLLPPTVFAALNPGIFNTAIAIAGGYGEAILNGLFPIGLVWAGRYSYKLNTERELFGGRPMLLLLLAVTIGIIWLETKVLTGS